MENSLHQFTEKSDKTSLNQIFPKMDAPLQANSGDEEISPELSQELISLLQNIKEEEDNLERSFQRRNFALGIGIPIFIIFFVISVVHHKTIFEVYASGVTIPSELIRGLIILTILIAIASPFYYYFFHHRVRAAHETLNRAINEYRVKTSENMNLRKTALREELLRLSAKSIRVFFDEPERSQAAMKLSANAGNGLDNASTTAQLSSAQNCIDQLNELVSRADREIRDQKWWQFANFFTIVIYVSGLLAVAIISANKGKYESFPDTVFGVPILVIVWGAAGSLATILYRFYTEQRRVRFAAEFRWLLARPIIGIIMGAVVYLALTSGVMLLQENPGTETTIRKEALWIIAFLAGFSDKFYLGVIDLLVARTVKSEEVKQNTVITEIERIPEGEAKA